MIILRASGWLPNAMYIAGFIKNYMSLMQAIESLSNVEDHNTVLLSLTQSKHLIRLWPYCVIQSV